MIEIFKSLILGGVQGISEFLPISSSGHLVLFPYVFNWDYRGLSFDVALHFGTVIAIIAYFWKDWIVIIRSAFKKSGTTSSVIPTEVGIQDSKPISGSPTKSGMTMNVSNDYPSNLLWQILIASIPAALVGFLINDYVEQYFHSPLIIASNLVFFGLVLWLIDKYSRTRLEIKDSKFQTSFLIGIAQSIALIPGVSRSGITMLAARGLGLSRESAARFSFILGTPAMVGAFLFEYKNISGEIFNIDFFIAVAASAFFGFIAIKYLLKYLQKGSFAIFAVYRIIIALLIVLIYLSR